MTTNDIESTLGPLPPDSQWFGYPSSYGVAWRGEACEFQVFAWKETNHLHFGIRRDGMKEWTIIQVAGEFGPIITDIDFREAFSIFWNRHPGDPVASAKEES